jgi:HTH-type transcriptional regulator/antitoxin HigA
LETGKRKGNLVITNERQYRITKAQLARFNKSLREFDFETSATRAGSPVLAQAELDALRSEVQTLAEDIKDYEELRSGRIAGFQPTTLAELHTVLIRARIALGLSQRELADRIGLKEQQVQRYEAQRYEGASLRRVLEVARALRIDAEFLNVSVSPADAELDWNKFPAMVMYRRGWFEGLVAGVGELRADRHEIVESYVRAALGRQVAILHKRSVRSGAKQDLYALIAWECRVLDLAKRVRVEKYSAQAINAHWLDRLRKLSIATDGPSKVSKVLARSGIALVIEPHLPGTKLDGAAFLPRGNSPVIGLTLRYDRLDNFWFVLFHELMHVLNHLRPGKIEGIFDDDIEDDTVDKLELEADAKATDALITPEEWGRALARFVQTEELVRAFAAEIGINPAIVAGRIRYEVKDYRVLSAIVGQGEVRQRFPDVAFDT